MALAEQKAHYKEVPYDEKFHHQPLNDFLQAKSPPIDRSSSISPTASQVLSTLVSGEARAAWITRASPGSMSSTLHIRGAKDDMQRLIFAQEYIENLKIKHGGQPLFNMKDSTSEKMKVAIADYCAIAGVACSHKSTKSSAELGALRDKLAIKSDSVEVEVSHSPSHHT